MNLLTIFLLSFITFFSRYLFLHPSLPLRLGPKMKLFLSFSAPAVLTSIWVPIIFIKDNGLNTSIANPYLIAALVAIFISFKTKNIYLTLVGSLLIFVLVKIYL